MSVIAPPARGFSRWRPPWPDDDVPASAPTSDAPAVATRPRPPSPERRAGGKRSAPPMRRTPHRPGRHRGIRFEWPAHRSGKTAPHRACRGSPGVVRRTRTPRPECPAAALPGRPRAGVASILRHAPPTGARPAGRLRSPPAHRRAGTRGPGPRPAAGRARRSTVADRPARARVGKPLLQEFQKGLRRDRTEAERLEVGL